MIKILLVDDDAVERTALKSILDSALEVEFVEVGDGQAALDLLCDGLRPGLCIFDLKMPRMTGIELIQRIRRDPELSNLLIMASSATRDRDTIVTLAKSRIAGYLLKPYDAAKTIAAVKPAIAHLMTANPTNVARNLLVKTLLLVDDDEVARTALRDIVRGFGQWEILECRDGQEALNRLFEGLRPDLAFVDLEMPRIDGIAFLKRIREEPTLRNLRVAVTSGDHDRDRVRALAQLQISGYLLKPFDPPKVGNVLRTIPDVHLIESQTAKLPAPAAPSDPSTAGATSAGGQTAEPVAQTPAGQSGVSPISTEN